MNQFYDRKHLLQQVVCLVLFVALCRATMGWGFLVLALCAAYYILIGRKLPLLTVFFWSTVAVSLNHYLMPKTLPMMVCQRGLLVVISLVILVQVFGRRQPREIVPYLSLLSYLGYMAVVSQFGWAPIISNLKLLLFTLGFLGFYGISVRVIRDESDIHKLRVMILAMAIFVVLGSMLTLAFPSIGQISEAELLQLKEAVSLFKGMSYHSQALGPIVGMLGTMLFADLTFTIQRRDWLYYLLLACCPYLIYLTSSRTAMGSFMVGMSLVAYFAMRSRQIKRSWRSKIVVNSWLVLAALSLAVLVLPSLRAKAAGFVAKNTEGYNVLSRENVFRSRSALIEETIRRWQKKPMLGNGFQVSEEMEGRQIKEIKDALSAPIEKSTWIYAILEEGGVFGMMLFVGFVLFTFFSLVKFRAYMSAVLFVQMLVVNLGEFGIFAMSSEGGMFWCMIFVATVFDHHRIQAMRQQRFLNYRVV